MFRKKEQNAKNVFLKILERNGEEQNGTDISLQELLKSGTRSKSGTHFKSEGMLLLNHLEIIKLFF